MTVTELVLICVGMILNTLTFFVGIAVGSVSKSK